MSVRTAARSRAREARAEAGEQRRDACSAPCRSSTSPRPTRCPAREPVPLAAAVAAARGRQPRAPARSAASSSQASSATRCQSRALEGSADGWCDADEHEIVVNARPVRQRPGAGARPRDRARLGVGYARLRPPPRRGARRHRDVHRLRVGRPRHLGLERSRTSRAGARAASWMRSAASPRRSTISPGASKTPSRPTGVPPAADEHAARGVSSRLRPDHRAPARNPGDAADAPSRASESRTARDARGTSARCTSTTGWRGRPTTTASSGWTSRVRGDARRARRRAGGACS